MFWGEFDRLKVYLDTYRSVSELPEGVSENDLEDISDLLTNLANKISLVNGKLHKIQFRK